MRSDDLNAILGEAGVASSWQAALAKVGVAVAKVVAPQLFAFVERVAVAGSVSLMQRLEAAMLPDEAVDEALAIVRGYERDHGENAPPDQRWPGTQRAEFAREAIRCWMVAQGGSPDAALVNQTMEEALGRLRLEQARINQRLASQGRQNGG